ncbi:hypothetical protein O0L34_g6147 [Tuta absoluta]|nr:hypothetical protein O0L34_g6147 [Tuta absoluta]
MIMKLQGYQLQIEYKPGKLMFIADTLSRAATEKGSDDDVQQDVTVHVNLLMENISVSPEKIKKIKEETQKDDSLVKVQECYERGWPVNKKGLHVAATQYWTVKDDIHVVNGIVFRNNQIVVPRSLRKEVLDRIHEGHLGIEKCKKRARDVVWWPGMSSEIEQCVQRCDTCQRHRAAKRREPVCPHPVPALPWEVVAADLFEIDQRHFLLVVDYYSKFVEVAPIGNNTTTAAVVFQMKNMFGRFGIPKKLVSDNGPQFAFQEFKVFADKWEFQHVTSSPLYPQSNGLAERNVQTVKRLIIKSREEGSDWQLALLNFRNTPIADEEFSSAQLLMGRRLNTRLPTSNDALVPTTVNPTMVKEKRENIIALRKCYYDRGTRPLQSLRPGDQIRMRENKRWVKARVKAIARGDRSYWVETEQGGTYRRNRKHLLKQKFLRQGASSKQRVNRYDDDDDFTSNNNSSRSGPSTSSACARDAGGSVQSRDHYVTRSGRTVIPPNRYQ